MKVKIISKEDVSLLVNNITAENFVLRLTTQGDQIVRYKV